LLFLVVSSVGLVAHFLGTMGATVGLLSASYVFALSCLRLWAVGPFKTNRRADNVRREKFRLHPDWLNV